MKPNVSYLTRAERAIVNSHFIYPALKLLRIILSPTNPKIILGSEHVTYRAGAAEGMHQTSISVGLDAAVVVRYRDVRPLIERRHVASVNERPARIAVGKAPLDRAVGKAVNYILSFFSQNGAANEGV